MPSVTTKHRPLFSGLGVKSQRPAPPNKGTGETEAVSSGTLTGVATRDSDDALVLVTNLHVLAGRDIVVGLGKKGYRLLNAAGNESLYQGGIGAADKIGSYADSTRLTDGQAINTDVGMVLLAEGVKAHPRLHGVGPSGPRYIAQDARAPVIDMQLVMIGAQSGEQGVIVYDLDYSTVIDGYDFNDIVRLLPVEGIILGDSGAGVFYKRTDSIYELVCIAFGAEDGYVYSFPASRAESLLGITFGKRPPIAAARHLPEKVTTGSEVLLVAAGSLDPDGDPLLYQWEIVTPNTGISLENSSTQIAKFTAPSAPTTLTFRVTVTNAVRVAVVATLEVEVVAPASPPEPTPEQPPVFSDWLTTGHTEGSCENRRQRWFRINLVTQEVTYEWRSATLPVVWDDTWTPTGNTRGCGPAREIEQERGNDCNDQKQTKWIAAAEDLKWTAAETGNTRGCGATKETEYLRTSQCGDTERVWKATPEAPPPPSAWARTGTTRGCGPSHESEESRTLGCGGTET